MKTKLAILLLLVSVVAGAQKRPISTFIVEYRDAVTGTSHLVRVESKDSVNAVFDALWPVTVWSAERWDEENKTLGPKWQHSSQVPKTVNQK